VAQGLPSFNIVGLPDVACRESSDRVRAALESSGFKLPGKGVTMNVAPSTFASGTIEDRRRALVPTLDGGHDGGR
jgi:predicted ATPase with chaperone activity